MQRIQSRLVNTPQCIDLLERALVTKKKTKIEQVQAQYCIGHLTEASHLDISEQCGR